MSEAALLTERIERIEYGFESAGLAGLESRLAIVVATLSAVDGRAPRQPIEAAYPILRGRDLKGAFPADLPGRDWLPAIRPELVGDAFVRRVLSTIDPDQAPEKRAKGGHRNRMAHERSSHAQSSDQARST